MIYDENTPYINAISVMSFNIDTKVNTASEIYFQENPPVGIHYDENLKVFYRAQDFYLTENEQKNHVYDIKSTNMLGRKEFCDVPQGAENQISSYIIQHTDNNFKNTPYELKENSLLAKVNWHIIEYSDTTKSENPEIDKQIFRLAKPKYFKNTEEETLESNMSINNGEYYVFKNDNMFTIQYLNDININDELFFGPSKSINDCKTFISTWAEINNYTLEKINTYNYIYF